MNIKQAKVSDCLAIKDFLHRSWEDTYHSIIPKKLISDILSQRHSKNELLSEITDPSVLFLLAKNSRSEIVGLTTLKIESDTDLFMGRLYIDKNHQKKGIGKALLLESLRFFPKHQHLIIEVQEKNKNAIDFYTHLGFLMIAKSEMYIQNKVIKTILLTKIINT